MTHPSAPTPGPPAPAAEPPGPALDFRAPWTRRADPRTPAYLVSGFGALIVSLSTGQPALAALGAPFLVLAILGFLRGIPTGLKGAVTLDQGAAVEGDLLQGQVTVDWDGRAEVDVILAGHRGIRPEEPAPAIGWALPAGRGPVTRRFKIRARSWGVHDMGALWIRARTPGSFSVGERKLALGPTLRVFPSTFRLNRLLKPAEPRTVAGMHLARLRGQGTDFAELRPYQPGDRLRDLSWATSARLGEPWVRVNHPERTGTVVIVLEALFGNEGGQKEPLARAARTAWTVASVHLRAQDRVGLLVRGRVAAWLPPNGGPRARWMLMNELLTVGRAAEDRPGRAWPRRRVGVPADALIVGVSHLRSQVFVPHILHYKRVGHTVAVLVIDTEDLLPEAGDRVDEAARRIWVAQRQTERRKLERGGVPTATVDPAAGAGPAILALRRRLEAAQRRAAAGVWTRP